MALAAGGAALVREEEGAVGGVPREFVEALEEGSRSFEFEFKLHDDILWPLHKRCIIKNVNLSAIPYSLITSTSDRYETSTIWFQNCGDIDKLPLDIFNHFPAVSGIMITHSNYPVIKKSLFPENFEVERIQFLSFYNNNTTQIEEDAFSQLANLRVIRLYGHIPMAFEHNYFKNNPLLEHIDFSWNKITAINPTLFIGLKKLRIVSYQKNGKIFRIGNKRQWLNHSRLHMDMEMFYKAYLDNLKSEKIVLKKFYDINIEKHDYDMKMSNKELTKLHGQIELYRRKNFEIEKRLNGELEAKSKEFEAEKLKWNEKFSTLEKELQGKNQEIDNLKKELAENQEEVKTVKRENKKLLTINSEMEEQLVEKIKSDVNNKKEIIVRLPNPSKMISQSTEFKTLMETVLKQQQQIEEMKNDIQQMKIK